MKNALEQVIGANQGVKILYCYHHLYKSLKFQIRQIIYNGKFSDRTKNIMIRVEKLPKIDSFAKLLKELEECRSLSEDIKAECPDINILVNKLY